MLLFEDRPIAIPLSKWVIERDISCLASVRMILVVARCVM